MNCRIARMTDIRDTAEDMITECHEQTNPSSQRNRTVSFDRNGNITVRNLSAYWIPEITVQKELHGTTYTVSGSYEGNKAFVSPLERIMVRTTDDDKDREISDDSEEDMEISTVEVQDPDLSNHTALTLNESPQAGEDNSGLKETNCNVKLLQPEEEITHDKHCE